MIPSGWRYVNEALFGKEHARSRGSKYEEVVAAVDEYQQLPKDEYQQFVLRAMKLQRVRDLATQATLEAKSEGHRKYLTRLAERAAGKAQYLQSIAVYLDEHVDQISNIKGFLDLMGAKRMPMVLSPPAPQGGWKKGVVGGEGFAMIGSVAFEQMDPYNREFEVHLGKGNNPWEGAHGGGLGLIMIEWAAKVLNQGYDKPFLAYLEKSDACHFSTSDHMTQRVGYAVPGQLLEGTSMVTADVGAGRLLEMDSDGELKLFDTNSTVGGKAGKHHAKAFVWTVQSDFVVGVHVPGKLHHSSLVGGGLVRAAGMIGATSGRVHYVDSNSGHYRPDPAHMHALILFLNSNDLFTSEACTNIQGNDVPIHDYLFNPARSFFGEGFKLGSHRTKKKSVVRKGPTR